MALSPEEVRHVAGLARLDLSDDDVARLAPELSAILTYAQQVAEVAAQDVPTTVHPVPLEDVTRPDEPGPLLDRGELLGQAPEVDDDRIVVPRIVAEDG